MIKWHLIAGDGETGFKSNRWTYDIKHLASNTSQVGGHMTSDFKHKSTSWTYDIRLLASSPNN